MGGGKALPRRAAPGNAATKNRKLVSGAGKKLWKQKGTGRARVGSIRTPLWRGGGTVHGPQPRSYEYAFPQKKLMGALRSALAAKIADGKMTVVDAFSVTEAEDQAVPPGADKLEAGKTALIVETSKKLEREAVPRLAQPRRVLSWCSAPKFILTTCSVTSARSSRRLRSRSCRRSLKKRFEAQALEAEVA